MAIKELLNKFILVHKCSSLQEAKQQEKDRLKILILAGIFGVAYLVFSLIPLGFFKTLSGFMMISFAICLAVGVWTWIKAHNEKDRLMFVVCKECGTKYELDNVKYSFVRERKSSGSPDKNGIIRFSVFHRYAFDCKCAKCGAEKYFEYDFLQNKGEIQGGRYSEYPVDVEKSIMAFFA